MTVLAVGLGFVVGVALGSMFGAVMAAVVMAGARTAPAGMPDPASLRMRQRAAFN